MFVQLLIGCLGSAVFPVGMLKVTELLFQFVPYFGYEHSFGEFEEGLREGYGSECFRVVSGKFLSILVNRDDVHLGENRVEVLVV